MIAGIVSFILGKFRAKKPKNNDNNIKRSVICNSCGWQGTTSESLKSDCTNDRCPICGESQLSYEI